MKTNPNYAPRTRTQIATSQLVHEVLPLLANIAIALTITTSIFSLYLAYNALA